MRKLKHYEFEEAIAHLPPLQKDRLRQRYEGKLLAPIAASYDPPISIRSLQYSIQHALETIDDPRKPRSHQLRQYKYDGRALIDIEKPERKKIYKTHNVPPQDVQMLELYLGITTGIPVSRKEIGERLHLRPAQIKHRFHKLGALFYHPNEIKESED